MIPDIYSNSRVPHVTQISHFSPLLASFLPCRLAHPRKVGRSEKALPGLNSGWGSRTWFPICCRRGGSDYGGKRERHQLSDPTFRTHRVSFNCPKSFGAVNDWISGAGKGQSGTSLELRYAHSSECSPGTEKDRKEGNQNLVSSTDGR